MSDKVKKKKRKGTGRESECQHERRAVGKRRMIFVRQREYVDVVKANEKNIEVRVLGYVKSEENIL